MIDWKASLLSAVSGIAAGTAFGIIAFYLLTFRQSPAMGTTLFLLVPVVAGFCIYLVARTPDSVNAAVAILSVVITLVLLVAFRREGVLCAVLAFPIIMVGLAIGVGIGALTRGLLARYRKSQTPPSCMLLIVAPLLIIAGERMEAPHLQKPRIEVIQTAIDVNDSAERVWNNILSIDSVHASKPILMYIGLPIPQQCTMKGRGVGAKRTCYFDVGYIEETVTEWSPPYRLGLSIDRTHMPGRHWLGFESAEYQLEPHGPSTKLIRRTTVSSRLHPTLVLAPV